MGMSCAGVTELLLALPQLRSLRLRHVCALPAAFVSTARRACPLLSHLSLDACDLVDGGFDAPHDAFGALQAVHLYRCVTVKVAVHGLGGGGCYGGGGSGTCGTEYGADGALPLMSSKVDGSVKLFDLCAGSTTSIPLV